MSTCREAHDADIVGIDAPDGRRVAHGTDGFLGITHGNGAVTARHAIGHDKEGNALTVKVPSPIVAFVLRCQMGVAAARQVDDGPSVRVRRQVGHHIGLPVVGDIDCKLSGSLRLQSKGDKR